MNSPQVLGKRISSWRNNLVNLNSVEGVFGGHVKRGLGIEMSPGRKETVEEPLTGDGKGLRNDWVLVSWLSVRMEGERKMGGSLRHAAPRFLMCAAECLVVLLTEWVRRGRTVTYIVLIVYKHCSKCFSYINEGIGFLELP